ncbi:hypothetical protein A33Q_2512 [Indibacter alkaliphilus LW1]|uniref:Uncharacterized protein n=1 Tax=Indibacter alkaliphilus (strain CCUG 57479 / KCTC 22604 / LW1) TaxID=1189612 RepID=S2DAH7_INDAL|nr:hypothetical protein A33Q_2512 [Indibacter alkaliphilus LW1]
MTIKLINNTKVVDQNLEKLHDSNFRANGTDSMARIKAMITGANTPFAAMIPATAKYKPIRTRK